MRADTRRRYNDLLDSMGKTYGVQSTKEHFAIEEPLEIRLRGAIQESDAFLNQITILPVRDLKGQPLGIQIHDSIAGRTDTSGAGRRAPQLAGAPDGFTYECKKTNYDVGITYMLLDTWAMFSNFRQLYMNAVYRRMALDDILIGWYGTSAAVDTDRVTNPLLQDVNLGWLKKLLDQNPAMLMLEGANAGEIRIGAGTGYDFANLDQLVYAVASMIPRAHRTGNEVAIIGEGLIAWDTGKVLEAHGQTPTERQALRTLDKSYGGKSSVIVPHFPDYGVMVTDLKNLQLLWQLGSMRRHTKEEPEADRVVDYQSSNNAYCFGDFDGVSAIEGANVKFWDGDSWETPA